MGSGGPGRAGLDRGRVPPLRRRRARRGPPPHLAPGEHGHHRARPGARRPTPTRSPRGTPPADSRRATTWWRCGGRRTARPWRRMGATPGLARLPRPPVPRARSATGAGTRGARARLGPSPRPAPTAVFLPMGLANPDHVLTHDAGLLARAALEAGRRPAGLVLLRGCRLQAPPRPPGLADLQALPQRSLAHARRSYRSSRTWPPSGRPSSATRSQVAPLERDHLLVRAARRECARAVLAARPRLPRAGSA